MPGPLPQTDLNDSPIILVTGLSGAGKSTALKALEDLGYEAVDNLPLVLLPPLLVPDMQARLAIGIDVRTRAFSPRRVLDAISHGAAIGRDIRILFLDCATKELIRRFSETRRRHPLAQDRPASDGIALEREMLTDLRRRADIVIDTSDFSPHDLRYALVSRFATTSSEAFTLTIMSFGYARGVPRDADLVFDMRFLKNPHWQPELRQQTGSDEAVQRYIHSDPAWAPAFQSMASLLQLLLPGYAREGRAYLTLAFGCTGGQHRSVATAIAMAKTLAENGWPANTVIHRDRAEGPDGDAKNSKGKGSG